MLAHALRIQKAYKEQGLTLTLRQTYYRFVAEGIMPSGQLHYKRLGDVLTDARYDGSFPIEGLEDRGRDVAFGAYTRNDAAPIRGARGAVGADADIDDHAMSDAAGWIRNLPSFLLRAGRWAGQPVHVSVWVEKQALEGVFEPVCTELGVSWFACKGYPSVSSLWDWIKGVQRSRVRTSRLQSYHFPGTDIEWRERHQGDTLRCVVLYFGDHDPDGWEIPRSAERNLRKLMDVKHIAFPLEFQRIALVKDQIDKYNPPAFEAKVSSARYRGYVEEHDTEEAWELDALEPMVLRDLIRARVEEHFDVNIHAENESLIDALRGNMKAAMRVDGWAAGVLGADGEEE
jgi:hypothetical protein